MDFQGFQNSLPFALALIIGILCCVLAWFSYHKYSSISLSWKVLLSLLRGSALLIIVVLIFNPFFKSEEEVEIKPKVVVLLDGSESTSISKGNYDGNRNYNEVIARLRDYPESISVDFKRFADVVVPVSPQNFENTFSVTNVYEAVDHISSSAEDYDAALLVTDGIITIGKNPAIEASNSSIPIHVISLGDTSKVKDVSIRNITSNGTGYTNTRHRVEVELSQFGFGNNQVNVELKSDEESIASQSVTLTNNKEIETIEFDFELSQEGLQQFQVIISPLNGEWTTENNTSSFSVDVLDSKTKILHLASGIHPDIKTIRSILQQDENIELSTYTYLGESRSIQELQQTDTYDVIIMHGLIPSSAVNELSLDIENTPTIYILLPDDQSVLSNENYTLIENSSSDIFEIQLYVNAENRDHPVLSFDEINLSSLPPVYSSINSSTSFPSAQILYESEFQNISTDSPVLAVNEIGNIRRSHLNAFGFYKIYQSPNALERIFISDLISNITDWTSTDPDNRLLKIRPVSNSISSGEPLIMNASVINENGDIEPSAVVELEIIGTDYRSDFTMSNLGDGNFRLQVQSLPEGSYSFSATARKGNRNIDVQSGEFLVTEANLELSNTIRNDDLLRNIALGSRGNITDFNNVQDYWSTSGILSNMDSKTEIREEYFFPVQNLMWFLITLLLLGSEWFIRKRFALP